MGCSRRSALAATLLLFGSVALSPARTAEGWQPDPKLVEAAQKEGEVLLYTTLIVDQIVRPLIKDFQARAPGVQIKYVRADGLSLVSRMINEARAGRVQSDVWCMVDGVHAAPAGRPDQRSSRCRARRACRRRSSIRKKRWVATNLGVRSAAYNTQLVPKAQAPRSYQDLLDPRWKGKIVWNPKSMTGAWGFIATVIKGMGEERGMDYLRALAKQNIVPLPIAIRADARPRDRGRIRDRARNEQHACRRQRRAGRAGRLGAAQSGERDDRRSPASPRARRIRTRRGCSSITWCRAPARRCSATTTTCRCTRKFPPKSRSSSPSKAATRRCSTAPRRSTPTSTRWAKIYEDLFR